jgi:hypothetical protein
MISDFPPAVQAFVKESRFWTDLYELNQNCATLSSFRVRFFQKFNAFKILKFLNYSHGKFYEKTDLEEQFRVLMAQSSA